MRTYFYQLLQSSTGLSGSVSSSAQRIEFTTGYSVQAIYTGGLNGTASLLSSNDGVTFDTITNTSQTFSGAGSFMWNVLSANYQYVQFSYTATSASSGLLSVNLFSKGF